MDKVPGVLLFLPYIKETCRCSRQVCGMIDYFRAFALRKISSASAAALAICLLLFYIDMRVGQNKNGNDI
ncbi:hypothetical protein EHV15_29090 [Paenibacillus oralis]|uniref:Uncharacterized protein n=1 Tax=Paenibacillus oralis TaxID=2490856 RepID=A0A3P3UA14_9BACL|nr:hypothetical protein EHV15_29090 [Paenibacillus oralis]